jgi:hypothetical protein
VPAMDRDNERGDDGTVPRVLSDPLHFVPANASQPSAEKQARRPSSIFYTSLSHLLDLTMR